MPVDLNPCRRLIRLARINHRNRGVSPQRDVHFRSFARTTPGHSDYAIWIEKLLRVRPSKIDAGQPPFVANVTDYAEAVSEIVRDIHRVAVGAERETHRINRREVVVIARRVCRRRERRDVDKRSFDLCVWSARARRDWVCRTRSKLKHPDLVFKSARSIEREAPVLLR